MAQKSAKRVLVVEDEDYLREAFAEVLKGTGVDLVLAEDGRVAVESMRKGPVALVVLDLNLPGLSGLRVLEWINQNARETPVLVITGLDKPPNVLSRFPNLVRIVQKKPVSNDLLRHLVETYAFEE